jgi:succinoglycan biosynthesis transport protein ExoP
MDLLTIIRILFKRKWIVIGLPFLATVAAVVLTADYKRTYRSTAQLSTGFTISPEAKVITERFNLYEVDVNFNNLIETINSPRVFTLLSYKLLLHDLTGREKPFIDVNELKSKKQWLARIDTTMIEQLLESKLKSMSAMDTYVEDERVVKDVLDAFGYDYESLIKVLNVARVKGTDYVSVVAYTENPYQSAFMVNTLCDEFLRYNTSVITARSDEAVQTFSRLVEEKKGELAQKNEELRLFKSSNSLLNLSAESENKIAQISQLETQRQDEDKSLRSINLQLEDINQKINASKSGSPTVSNTEIVEIRKRISILNQQYIATGSKDKKLLDSLNSLRSKQQRLISASQGTISTNVDDLISKKNELEIQQRIAQQNLAAVESLLNRLQQNVGGYASKEAQILVLEQEVNAASEEYRAAQEKYNKSLDVALANGNSIRQVLFGQPANDPEPSKRLIITGLTGISTFVLCILVIVLAEYIDVSIKSSSNFSSSTGLNLIGMLNELDFQKVSLNDLFRLDREQLSKEANAFRELLRKLRYEFDRQNKHVFLITSTKPNEGKTSVITALSMVLSFSGSKILIIDMNFSNNRLTRKFKTSSALESVFRDKNKLPETAITETTIEGVDILGCQGGNYTPNEIFDQDLLQAFIDRMKKRYDYIFIEGAPLNAYSDSKEISFFVEGVVAVFSAKSVIKQSDRESIEFLTSLDDKWIGAVLNSVKLENMEA